MGYKSLELTVISANDLKSVNLTGKMDVYVVVSLAGVKKKTPVDQDGGSSPYWNAALRFKFDEGRAVNANWTVVFKLKHHRTFGWDKVVGEVRVPVKDLLADKLEAESVTYQVRRPSGKIRGELKLSYKVSDAKAPPPVAAKPRPQASSSSAPCPHAPPQQHGYGYGYGYPHRPRRNDDFGMGLIGGVIGGILIDEIFDF